MCHCCGSRNPGSFPLRWEPMPDEGLLSGFPLTRESHWRGFSQTLPHRHSAKKLQVFVTS